MTSGGYGAALFLLAAFAWFDPAGGAEAADYQSRQSAADRLPMSTKCAVKCDELEKACEEHERLRPTCSVVNICLEEKLQCEAQCRPRATLNRRARS